MRDARAPPITGAAHKRFCVNTPADARAGIEPDDQQILAIRLADAGLRRPRARCRGWERVRRASRRQRLTGIVKILEVVDLRLDSRSSEPAVAMLVFLARAARTRIVAADFAAAAHEGLRLLDVLGTATSSPSAHASAPAPADRNRHADTARSHCGHALGLLDLFARAHLHRHQVLGHLVLDPSAACRRTARRPRACIPASGSSARSRAGGCPGAGGRAARGARASACPGSAA